ncbi:MAG: ATP-dependent protease ATPase subunit HslU [Syntrophomonadaceae bacterium]|jgi:ATP-dependent HslUV protease ATP-binding subunit HslU|nr:ATP-dependent protease ATPase subunit HslU [Bacillota bacterium]NLM88458.1 ATP-dependent protease ATPase subunit HslU [Syntrophomonadaceae bacterium]HQA49089.1 ATP-dependent protease ATPase subunit HslU [Syntrophomonadaceae bacterium]HQD89461.1 ATP-dependent protease ATPase subunit HslU [Syntrophomonadaceae bacterium]
MTPREIVRELDKYIVGQDSAKKAVAIALRNRYRRKMLSEDLRDEVYPKNIIMIGSTGVGKTEIARRLARLVKAPFIKVEASKFTEVGYVGRDVDSMVRDLVETSISMVKSDKYKEVEDRARELAEERIVDTILPLPKRKNRASRNPLELLLGGVSEQNDSDDGFEAQVYEVEQKRQIIRQKLSRMELEQEVIEIEVEESSASFMEIFSGSGVEEMGINLQDLFGSMIPKKRKKRRVTVEEAKKIFTHEEAQRLMDMDEIHREAIRRAEQDGIIFLDEIDKIAGKDSNYGPDVSRGGVQRDILPIVEGSTVVTKYGPVKTDHILFIAAGAFHVSKPSDLIPELQGRFPIRVELESLTREDLRRIITEPHNSLIKQYVALLETEKVHINFTDEAIDYIADMAYEVNIKTENIGARRLYTIMEKVLEDLLFDAPDHVQETIEIDKAYVAERLKKIVEDEDLSRYIL